MGYWTKVDIIGRYDNNVKPDLGRLQYGYNKDGDFIVRVGEGHSWCYSIELSNKIRTAIVTDGWSHENTKKIFEALNGYEYRFHVTKLELRHNPPRELAATLEERNFVPPTVQEYKKLLKSFGKF